MLHKTDGSYVNRPFFRCRQDVRNNVFSPKDILSRSVFCFFSSRKEIVPPSFLFRRKNGQLAREAQPPQTDGRRHILRCRRSEYHSGYASLLRLVSARVRRACAPAFPCKPTSQKKIICGKAIILHCCLFRQRAMQNGRFTYEPSVFRTEQDVRESIFLLKNHLSRSVFCFFSSRKENVPLSEEKKSFSFIEEKKTSP